MRDEALKRHTVIQRLVDRKAELLSRQQMAHQHKSRSSLERKAFVDVGAELPSGA